MSEQEKLLTYLQGFITQERQQLFAEILRLRTNHFTVAIEDVFQAHNASAVMRSCDIFGVQNLHFIQEKYGKSIDKNIAMGAQKWVTIHRYASSEDCLQRLKNQGYRIVATTPSPNATSLEDFDIRPKSALFFGTEKKGLSQFVLQNAHEHLYIPMVGFTQSLNISVSVAIILQNLTQQLRSSSLHWQLSPQEQTETLLQWTKNSVRSLNSLLSRYYNKA